MKFNLLSRFCKKFRVCCDNSNDVQQPRAVDDATVEFFTHLPQIDILIRFDDYQTHMLCSGPTQEIFDFVELSLGHSQFLLYSNDTEIEAGKHYLDLCLSSDSSIDVFVMEEHTIDLFVRCNGKTIVITCNGKLAPVFERLSHELGTSDFFLTTGSKVLDSTKHHKMYNLYNGSTLYAYCRFRGGVKLTEITTPLLNLRNYDPEVGCLVEDVMFACIQLFRSRNVLDVSIATCVFVKARTGRSVVQMTLAAVSAFVDKLFTGDMPQLQGSTDDFSALKAVSTVRDVMHNWEELRETTIGKKLMVVVRYMITYGCFTRIGIEPTKRSFSKMEEVALTPYTHAGFAWSVLDFTTFTLQRTLLYAKTGEWSVFLHGPKTYAAWFEKCMEIKRTAHSLGNLEAQGTEYFKFVGDVKECIENGKAIVRFSSRENGAELRAARQLLNEIMIVEAEILTQKSAQQERRAPFGVLIYGGSSVAKSAFTKMLFYYYGKLLNLPVSDEYKYTRNSATDFWDGFTSQKWCIQMDDVAYLHAAKAMEDRSLLELIAIVNNVPLVPNQAKLEDKGRTPVRAKLVIASTNTKHINAATYFQCPLAVQRRLPWVITVEPKPELARDDAPEMIDPMKLQPIEGEWPDYWLIKVEKVVPGGLISGDRAAAKHEKIAEFSDINLFLDWFRDVVLTFEEIQGKAMFCDEAMKELKLCLSCNRTEKKCTCLSLLQAKEGDSVRAHAHFTALPQGKAYGDDFTLTSSDGIETEVRRYQFADGRYTCVTTISQASLIKRRWAAPAYVGTPDQAPTPNDKELADLLDDVLRVARKRAPTRTQRITHCIVGSFVSSYVRYSWLRDTVVTLSQWWIFRRLMVALILSQVQPRSYSKTFFEILGAMSRGSYASKHWRNVLAVLGVLGAAALAYKLFTAGSEEVSPPKVQTKQADVVSVADSAELYEDSDEENYEDDNKPRKPISCPQYGCPPVQGTQESTLRKSCDSIIFPRTEKENVWKNDDYVTTNFDTRPLMKNLASLPHDQFASVVRKNCAHIKVVTEFGTKEANAFCVGGRLWVANNHIFVDKQCKFTVSLKIDPEGVGLNRNITFVLDHEELYRQFDRDLIWFQAGPVNVRRDLTELLVTSKYNARARATYIGFDLRVRPQSITVKACDSLAMYYAPLDKTFKYWMGTVDQDTVNGDCGSVLVHSSPNACILGLHQLGGRDKRTFAVKLLREDFEEARDHFQVPLLQEGIVEISAPSAQKTLGELHHRSPLRWISEGSIAAFGTFTGYRAKPRSRVEPTFLGDVIKQERGWEVPFGAPDLKDWRPWHHAYKDATAQTHAFTRKEVREVAKTFAKELLEGVDENTKKIFEPLTTHAAVNGIPGVQFIDKMNFNTSMGEPYNKSKKGFITECEPYGQQFDQEVLDKVEIIEAAYARGERANPVFSGQLKDEARALKKLADGKVRVFTGAPVAWSIVMRKFCLPFVKIMQENPTLFESAPGCVVQSLEWEKIRDYLTKFGSDTMIAGDYGKFDKKMSPVLILAAFEIIADFARGCGWTEEEVQVFYLLGEDCAFPYVNMGGDLVMFYGSNPSGQALTVIVNCLVNCMYMRLAYKNLNPEKECHTFKQNVALMTYGDDNGMGVRPSCTWFTHTRVSAYLARYGVEYTMADKEAESRPYISIDELSFLKRLWRWDGDVGAYVAPLELESIRKMLCVRTRTSDIGTEAHMAQVICAANNEWFFHGKEVFDKEHAWLWSLVERFDLHAEIESARFESWEGLKERFWRSSDGIETKRLGVYHHTRGDCPK
jgi:hypothetical protein